MFQIGEFAQIAQVSTRQLRFYDELGLFRPDHIDRQTGYRYYAIRQLPRLNAILALKDLGLSLDQIGLLLENAITPSELRGILLLKKAETEQAIRIEKQRLRHIESRISQIDLDGGNANYDVVTKALRSQTIFATHLATSDLAEAGGLVASAAAAARAVLRPAVRGNLIVLARNEPDADRLDLTVGYVVSRSDTRSLTANGLAFSSQTLPAVDLAATVVRTGTNPESHTAFGAIGTWIEMHGYAIAGPSREVFLEPVLEQPGFDKALVEIQFPIAAA